MDARTFSVGTRQGETVKQTTTLIASSRSDFELGEVVRYQDSRKQEFAHRLCGESSSTIPAKRGDREQRGE